MRVRLLRTPMGHQTGQALRRARKAMSDDAGGSPRSHQVGRRPSAAVGARRQSNAEVKINELAETLRIRPLTLLATHMYTRQAHLRCTGSPRLSAKCCRLLGQYHRPDEESAPTWRDSDALPEDDVSFASQQRFATAYVLPPIRKRMPTENSRDIQFQPSSRRQMAGESFFHVRYFASGCSIVTDECYAPPTVPSRRIGN